MGLADLHALVPVLAAAGEKSKTSFYIAGGLLAAWAVIVSAFGLTRPDFPHNVTGSRGVMGVSALLVAATIGLAVATASPPPKSNEAKASTGGAQAQVPPPPPAGPQAQGGQPAQALALASDPSGQLTFDKKALAARAGAVKIDFTNASPVAHNVTIEQNGKALTATQTITQSKASVTAQLRPGSYTFYCSVDAHRQGGMVGTLKVS
jgi:plastocyanin